MEGSIRTLLQSIEKREWMGYDPYDALNSPLLRKIPSKFFRLAFTQFFVYSPINFRNVLGVKDGVNPKSLGLELQALCALKEANSVEEDEFTKRTNRIVEMLLHCRSNGYQGLSWGFNFPWQDLTRFTKPNLPTIVNTSTIGNGLLDLFTITEEENILKMVNQIRLFILNEINRYRNENGICFSYTPIDSNVVHNASLLGTSILARLDNKEDRELINDVIRFTIHYQRKDGSWPYSLNKENGKERMQIDFHQGFNLDCLIAICQREEFDSDILRKSIISGAEFYFNEQFENGRSLWRWPKKWPIDIHHQAQGIITAVNMYTFTSNEKYKEIAKEIIDFTIDTFKKRDGNFAYQKWPILNNRINYIRWADEWMLLALSRYYQLCSDK